MVLKCLLSYLQPSRVFLSSKGVHAICLDLIFGNKICCIVVEDLRMVLKCLSYLQ